MGRQRSRVVLRSTALAISASLAGWLTWRLTRDRLLDAATRVIADGPAGIADLPFDVALTTICAAAMAACAGWLLLVTVAVALEAVLLARAEPSGPAVDAARVTPARWLCPRSLRRLLLAGCGAALVTGLAGPGAFADAAGSHGPPASGIGPALTGLAVPDRVGGPAARPRAGRVVVVRPGDTLWSLAEEALGERPTDAETALGWRAIYDANDERIGPDPDLILPGTELAVPDMHPSQRKESS